MSAKRTEQQGDERSWPWRPESRSSEHATHFPFQLPLIDSCPCHEVTTSQRKNGEGKRSKALQVQEACKIGRGSSRFSTVALHLHTPALLATATMFRAAASRLRAHSPSGSPHALCRLFSKPSVRIEPPVTAAEARRLVRLVGVEALKRRLQDRPGEAVGYGELLDACVEAGAARTRGEAEGLARAMDDAGVLLLFRDKAYLHPEKVVDLVRRAVPLVLELENDPRKEEFKQLQEKKDDIDKLAHKQVRCILWSGLGFLMSQVGLFFRLTFWELSWDVMEPIAFFATASGLLVSYTYFLVTSRDPTYQDFMERLFLSRRRKLCFKHRFNMERYLELQKYCKCPLEAPKLHSL